MHRLIKQAIEAAIRAQFFNLHNVRITEIAVMFPAAKPCKKVNRKSITPYARRKARERNGGTGFTQEEFTELCYKYGNQCLACGSRENIVPDHVIPMYRGGSHSISNIQPLCLRCNFVKGLQIVDYR